MISRNAFASILMAGSLAVGSAGLAPAANAAPAGPSVLDPGASTRTTLVKIDYYDRGHRIYLPVGPSSLYYDYSYYHSRGYYPSHVGPHYIYYGNGYGYGRGDEEAGDDGAPYSAQERCAQRFRSFEWDTGLYTTYGGHKRLCPYLR
jgi:BA14K-like protein